MRWTVFQFMSVPDSFKSANTICMVGLKHPNNKRSLAESLKTPDFYNMRYSSLATIFPNFTPHFNSTGLILNKYAPLKRWLYADLFGGFSRAPTDWMSEMMSMKVRQVLDELYDLHDAPTTHASES